MSWTDERIATLRKMWEGGATASEIAITANPITPIMPMSLRPCRRQPRHSATAANGIASIVFALFTIADLIFLN